MKKSYLTTAFQKTAKNYPAQTETLNVAFDARLSQLRRENADASAEKQRHLESQILPGIAAYETLQMVMPKEQALSKSTCHLCREDAEAVRPGGRLCSHRDSDHRRRLAD